MAIPKRLPAQWLRKSLAKQQFENFWRRTTVFLKDFVTAKLPVNSAASNNTKENMYLETSPEVWKLYGKTGTNMLPAIDWFVGFIEKSGQTYIFVTNMVRQGEDAEIYGIKAKEITKKILTARGIF